LNLPLHEAVADDDEPSPDRPSRRVAAGTPRRPRLGATRHLRHPGLDPERARDEPGRASCV